MASSGWRLKLKIPKLRIDELLLALNLYIPWKKVVGATGIEPVTH